MKASSSPKSLVNGRGAGAAEGAGASGDGGGGNGEDGGGLRGWLRTGQRSGVGQLAATVHPDNEDSLGPVVDFGLDQLKRSQPVYCLVPEYEVALQRVLMDRGFEPVSEYVTLVKTIAVAAKENAHARATIASG